MVIVCIFRFSFIVRPRECLKKLLDLKEFTLPAEFSGISWMLHVILFAKEKVKFGFEKKKSFSKFGFVFVLFGLTLKIDRDTSRLIHFSFSNCFSLSVWGGFYKPIYTLRQALTLWVKLLRLKKPLKSSAQSVNWFCAQLLPFMKSTPVLPWYCLINSFPLFITV